MKRLRAIYRGRVQGVGFRMTVRDLASSLDVTGEVCNRADGSVEVQAEGEEAGLERLLQAIDDAMGRNIADRQLDWQDAVQPRWSGFQITPDRQA